MDPKEKRINIRLTEKEADFLEKKKNLLKESKSSILIEGLDHYIIKTSEEEDLEYLLELSKTNSLILNTILLGKETSLNIKKLDTTILKEYLNIYNPYSKKVGEAISKRAETFLENYLSNMLKIYKKKYQIRESIEVSFRMAKANEILEISREIENNLKELMNQYNEITNLL